MKKLLLGLGTLSLAILPIVAIASCSSTSNPAPTLEAEVAKFNKSFETKDKTLTTISVIDAFTKEASQSSKLELLKTFVDLPSLTSGFNLEINSTNVNQTTNSSVDVNLTILDTKADKASDTILTITNLVAVPATLETEAGKFNAPVKTIKPLIMALDAVQTITNANGAAAKLKALEAFANVPKIDNTFELEVKSAAVGSPTTTNADIKITIKEKATPSNTKEVTLVVTDFSVTTIAIEAAKFVPTRTKTNSASSIDAAQTINQSQDKKAALQRFATTIPDLSSHFDYVVKSASPSKNVSTSLDVIITVNRISAADSSTIIESKDTTFVITDFKPAISSPSLELEAAKFTPAKNKVNYFTSANGVINIIKARPQAEKLKQLKIIATVPTLSEGIEMIINSPSVNSKADTSVDYLITLVDTKAPIGTNTKDIIFTIEGFKQSNIVELGLVRLYKQAELLIDKEIPETKKNETAAEAALVLNAETFTQYYPQIALANNYSYRWSENKVVGDTIVVKTFVRSQSQSTEWFITLSGFKPAA